MCSIESGDFRHPTGMLYRDQRTTRPINILQKFDKLNRKKKMASGGLRSPNDESDEELNYFNLSLSDPVSHALVSQCTCSLVDRKQVKGFDKVDSKNQSLCYLKDTALFSGVDVSDKNKKGSNKKHSVNFTNCDRYLDIKKRSQMDYKVNNHKKFSLSK